MESAASIEKYKVSVIKVQDLLVGYFYKHVATGGISFSPHREMLNDSLH